MQYLCLCHYSLKNFGSFGPAEFEEIGRICEPHDAELKASGKVRLIGSLAMPDEFRTLRANRDGSIDVSEGPYASTDEPFGAFFIVEANSMDEAERMLVCIRGLISGILWPEESKSVRSNNWSHCEQRGVAG